MLVLVVVGATVVVVVVEDDVEVVPTGMVELVVVDGNVVLVVEVVVDEVVTVVEDVVPVVVGTVVVVLVVGATVVVVVGGLVGALIIMFDEAATLAVPTSTEPAVDNEDEPLSISAAFGASIPAAETINFDEPSIDNSDVFPWAYRTEGTVTEFPANVSATDPLNTNFPPCSLLQARASPVAVPHANKNRTPLAVTAAEPVTVNVFVTT